MRKTVLLYFLLPLLVAAPVVAQTAKQPAESRPTVETIIKVLNVNGMATDEIEQLTKSQNYMDKALASGQASISADVRIVGQAGKLASFTSGQRVPIQTSSLAIAAIQPGKRTEGAAASVAAVPLSAPQIQYENAGITANVLPSVEPDGTILLDISLSLSTIASTQPTLTPTFSSRHLSNTVRVRQGELSLLAWDVAPKKAGSAAVSFSPSEQSKPVGDDFVILVTSKVLDR
jgi:Flp pilus assembly secretin CpaC